jgi:hypothetical protein
MSIARGRGFLLPPRPRLRDWPLAGAGAGCLLAGAELALAAGTDTLRAPFALIAWIVAYHACSGAALAGFTALVLRSRGIRLCYSAAAGSIVGVQGALLAFDAFFATITLKQAPGAAVAAAIFALAAASGAGGLVARIGERMERSGLPLHAPAVWLASALVLALASGLRGAEGGSGIAVASVVGVAPVLGWLSLQWSRQRGVKPRGNLAALGATAAFAVSALMGLHQALPWIRYASAHRALPELPPVVLLSAGPDLAAESRAAVSELIGWRGVRYRSAEAADTGSAALLLQLRDGRSLARALRESGYASASAHAAAAPPESDDFAEVDPGEAPLTGIARRAPGLRGLAWLRCCADPLVSGLRLDAPRRTPAELTQAAAQWLLDWRTHRAETPFVFWVDYRGAEGESDALVSAISALLRQLDQHEVGPRALVVLALPEASGDRASYVVRPPEGWAVPDRPSRAPHRLRESDLGTALLAAVASRAERPTLPGLEPSDAS